MSAACTTTSTLPVPGPGTPGCRTAGRAPRCLAAGGRRGHQPQGLQREHPARPARPRVGHPRRHRCLGQRRPGARTGRNAGRRRRRAHRDGAVGQPRRHLQLGRRRLSPPSGRPGAGLHGDVEAGAQRQEARQRLPRRRVACKVGDVLALCRRPASGPGPSRIAGSGAAAAGPRRPPASPHGAGRPRGGPAGRSTCLRGPSKCWQKRMPSNTSSPVIPSVALRTACAALTIWPTTSVGWSGASRLQ